MDDERHRLPVADFGRVDRGVEEVEGTTFFRESQRLALGLD